MIWLFIAWLVTLSVGCLIAYCFGRYWLGYGRFREHLRSIRWSAYAGFPDKFHWGIALAAWLDADEGMHFTSTGVMVRIGPFTAGFQGVDSN